MADLITDLTDADIRTEWRTNVAILDQTDDETDGGSDDAGSDDSGDTDGTDTTGDTDGNDG